MKGIKIIFSKEMKRVFKDPKMIFSLFILPVILMVGLYSLIGYLGEQEQEQTLAHTPIIHVQNMPQDVSEHMKDFLSNANLTYLTSADSTQPAKDGIYNGTIDLLVVFPETFTQDVTNYQNGGTSPEIFTFYNPSENYSSLARENFINSLKTNYEKAILAERLGGYDMLTVFTIDENNPNSIIQDTQKASGKFLSMMLPYLITILLFSGTMSLGTDAITGEKERGTMASMLVTPINRSEIVLGKLLSLTVLSILSASVYVVALTLSIPKTMSSLGGNAGMEFSFTADQIIMIAALILTLAFLYVALVGIVSVFSRTIKEASTYVTPLYLLVIVAGLFTMMSPAEGHETYQYLIPIYNCSIALGEIFTKDLTIVHFIMTLVSTVVTGGILTAIIAKAFGNEKVMFNA